MNRATRSPGTIELLDDVNDHHRVTTGVLANRTSYTDLDVPVPHRINRDTRS